MLAKLKVVMFLLAVSIVVVISLCAENWARLYLADQLPDNRSVDELISDFATRNQVDKLLVTAIIEVESSGGKYLNNFEPATYAKRTPARSESEFDRRAMATSHGLMHVMGFNAKLCDLEWFELYDDKKNLQCGIKLLKSCLDKRKGDITKALACYNGDPEVYPNKVKIALAELILKKG